MLELQEIIEDKSDRGTFRHIVSTLETLEEPELGQTLDFCLTQDNLSKLKAIYKSGSGVKKARVLELCLVLIMRSPDRGYSILKNEGVFSSIFEELFESKDELLKLNYVELLVQSICNRSAPAIELVKAFGLFDYMLELIDPVKLKAQNSETQDDISMLYIHFCIKYAATMAPHTESEKIPLLLKTYEALLKFKDEEVLASVIFGVHELCKTVGGLKAIQKSNYKVLRLINMVIEKSIGRIKVLGFGLYSGIFNLELDSPPSDPATISDNDAIIEEIYYIFNESFKTPGYIIELCKQPIEEFKEIGYSILKGIVQRNFGLRLFVDNEGFNSFVLNRDMNKTYVDSQNKYELASMVVSNKKEFENISDETKKRYQKYCQDGPIYRSTNPEVSFVNK